MNDRQSSWKGPYNARRRRDRVREDALTMCPICQKPVRDLYSAITHQGSESPAHFNCILKVLRENTELFPHEKICYLGSGSFGVIQFRNINSPIRFFIRKRIQYEPADLIPDWRKKLFFPAAIK